MSAGFRSTEFWMTSCGVLSGWGVALFGLFHGDDAVALAGTALAGLSIWTYGHARGKAKGRPYLPPGGKL